jgi:drug/metabolite transporter (DMT)-like permease
MIYIPFLSALSFGIGTIFEKIALKRKGITPIFYTITQLFFIVLLMLPFVYFFWEINSSKVFLPFNILYFLIIVLFSLIANIFLFKSLKIGKVNNLEPARALEPLLVIILAFLFSFIFGEEIFERENNILLPAFIAGGALVFSHIKKEHIYFNKAFIFALIGSLFFSFEIVFSKLILDFYSPLSFYFLRCFFALILGLIIFKTKFSNINSKFLPHYFVVGLSWIGYRVLMYYGFKNYGIIFTTLVLMLAPIFIFTFAHFILKEKMNWKNVISSFVIIGCVLYVLFI